MGAYGIGHCRHFAFFLSTTPTHSTHTQVILVRGDLTLSYGHHEMTVTSVDSLEVYKHPTYFPIDHYKWTSVVSRSMQQRRAHYQKVGYSFWKESDAVVTHLVQHNGSICVTCDNFCSEDLGPKQVPVPLLYMFLHVLFISAAALVFLYLRRNSALVYKVAPGCARWFC